MKYIYFARSLRGDRRVADEPIYQGIMRAIRATPGFRPQFDLPVTFKRIGLTTEQYIYCRDLSWLDRSDAVVAEITNVSHGVGYELAYAVHVRKVPVLCVAAEGTKVSAMLSGSLPVLFYQDISDLEGVVASFLVGLHDR